MFVNNGVIKKAAFTTLLFLALGISSTAALAATYDMTGTWELARQETSTTCAGNTLITEVTNENFIQLADNTWSTTDPVTGDITGGTVNQVSYTGQGNDPNHGSIGTETNVTSDTWFVTFDLTSANSGSGSETDTYSDILGVPVCQTISIFTLTRISGSTHTTPATTVLAPQVLQTATTNIVNLISNRISNSIRIRRPASSQITSMYPNNSANLATTGNVNDIIHTTEPGTPQKNWDATISQSRLGLSAGSPNQKVGVWGNIALSFTDNTQASNASKIDMDSYIAGADYKVTDKLVTGVAFTYETTDATNTFNQGSLEAKGYSVVPYIAYLFNDSVSVEALYGHTWVDTDQIRNISTTSSTNSNRDFFSTSVNAYKSFANLNCAGNLTYTYADENVDSFVESTLGVVGPTVAEAEASFSQFSVGLELSYLIGQFEPYTSISYDNDVTHTDIAGVIYDKSGGTFGLGLRMSLMDALSADIDYSELFNRDFIDSYTLSANIRYDF